MQVKLCRPSAMVLAGALLLSVACGTASQSQTHSEVGEASGGSVESVVARIGDREITMSELDQKVLATNVKIFQDLYDARRAALGDLVADALLAREAEKRSITVDELVEQEITSDVTPVTDEDIEAFYEQNSVRLRGQTLEQVGPQIREFMESRNEGIVRQSYIDGLRDQASVHVALFAASRAHHDCIERTHQRLGGRGGDDRRIFRLSMTVLRAGRSGPQAD